MLFSKKLTKSPKPPMLDICTASWSCRGTTSAVVLDKRRPFEGVKRENPWTCIVAELVSMPASMPSASIVTPARSTSAIDFAVIASFIARFPS